MSRQLVANRYVSNPSGPCLDDHSNLGDNSTATSVTGAATLLLADVGPKVFTVDTGSFLAIVVTGAVAGTVAAVAGGRGLFLPVVVLELVLGVVIGPQGLHIAHVNDFTQLFSDLGLGMLFFFAGYEIDIPRIRGRPLRLALFGWAMSLAIAYGLGGALAAAGVVVSLVYVGSALATTAIGTLLPVLSDTGELSTEFGTYLLAAGAVGEFGPVLLLTLVLSTQSAVHNAVILVAFVALAVAVALVAVRSSGRTLPLFERTIEKSSQLAVRWIVVLVFALGLLASDLGLDLLLGGFAAGMITRLVLRKHEVPGFDPKLTAVAFGVFIPFFFVVSGMRLDIDALFASASGVAKLVLFFVLFLVVRGTPALLLYRGVLPRERTAWRLHCSARRSCRSSSQSPPSPCRKATCVHRPRPPSSALGRFRPSPARSTGCTCAGSGRSSARPNTRRQQQRRKSTSLVSRDRAARRAVLRSAGERLLLTLGTTGAADADGVGGADERELVPVVVDPRQAQLERVLLTNQRSVVLGRQRFEQTLKQRRHPARDLWGVRAIPSNLGQREVYQLIPVRGGEQQSNLPIIVFDRGALKRAVAQPHQHRFERIETLDSTRRIVDRRRKCSNRNVDSAADRERRILLKAPPIGERQCPAKCPRIDRRAAADEQDRRVVADVGTDRRCELDDCARGAGGLHQSSPVDADQELVPVRVPEDRTHRCGRERPQLNAADARPGIDVLDGERESAQQAGVDPARPHEIQ